MRLEDGDAATMAVQQLDHDCGSTRCWHFCPEHMELFSPSREDGISHGHEASLRKSYCVFMQTLGRKLGLPQVTIATGIVFCHRFFLRQSLARNDSYQTIATVCLFLAGKVEETPERLQNIIIVSYEVRHAEEPDAALRIQEKEVYNEQKALLLMGERLVLVTLGFNLTVVHPYKPLIGAIKRLTLPKTHTPTQLAQIAWNFVNDGLDTLLSVWFKPCHIAAGAIYLAAKFLRIKLSCDWAELLSKEFDIGLQQLEDVSNQILQSYAEPSVAKSPGTSKLVRIVAPSHTEGWSAKKACTCAFQEATSALLYKEESNMRSSENGALRVNGEEKEASLAGERYCTRSDYENARSHTGHSDVTEEKEVPGLHRSSPSEELQSPPHEEAEDYWGYEGSRSGEANHWSMEDHDARSRGNLWHDGRDRSSRRVGRHLSPSVPNGRARARASMGSPDRYDQRAHITGRERGVHKGNSSRQETPLGVKKDAKKFATRRNFLLWLSSKKAAAAARHCERVSNRQRLCYRKAKMLAQHWGRRSRGGMRESCGMRTSRQCGGMRANF